MTPRERAERAAVLSYLAFIAITFGVIGIAQWVTR